MSLPANRLVVNVDCSEYFNTLDPAQQPRKTGTWCHSWQIADQLDRGAHRGGDEHLDGLGKQRAPENLVRF
jgi:hypothetical protein